jgi:hypothetical protein
VPRSAVSSSLIPRTRLLASVPKEATLPISASCSLIAATRSFAAVFRTYPVTPEPPSRKIDSTSLSADTTSPLFVSRPYVALAPRSAVSSSLTARVRLAPSVNRLATVPISASCSLIAS